MDAPAPTATTLWHRVLTDPQLRDLPFKIETEEPDRIILSPHKARHSLQQARLVALLLEHLSDGEPAVEFAVETPRGVKVPDVVWISEATAATLSLDDEASRVMPEIVIEVLSRSNAPREMDRKMRLYFDGGAREVWLCDADGRLRFFGADGERDGSAFAPALPRRVPS